MAQRNNTGFVSGLPSVLLDEGEADRHLDVDSRSGSLYCQICDDLVWDPTLEELRVRKIGTGSFSGSHLGPSTSRRKVAVLG